MNFKSLALTLGAATLATGCATSSFDYSPPSTSGEIVNTKIVNQPFDTVWDQLVRRLSSDFFVINNIEKNSRLINLSFTAQRPSDYVDCGLSTRSFTNAQGKRTFTYNAADSAMFTVASPQGIAFNSDRRTRLEGRTNIYVAPEGAGTLVTVNTKYVLSINVSLTSLDGRPAGNQTYLIDFSTKEPGGDDVRCSARGIIERRILGFVD